MSNFRFIAAAILVVLIAMIGALSLSKSTGSSIKRREAPHPIADQIEKNDHFIPDEYRIDRKSPPQRIIAIGDLHGDYSNALRALMLSGLIDAKSHWIAVNTTFVQTGDIVDRGPDTIKLFDMMQRLTKEAPSLGSRVVALLGNHEVMNMMDDLRFVVDGDYASYGGAQNRAKEWSSSGKLGKYLRSLDLVAWVNGTVFMHGGITPQWAERGINYINQSARRSLYAQNVQEMQVNPVFGDSGPLWDRSYAQEEEKILCGKLDLALSRLHATRMVIGHTPQVDGLIKARCNGRVVLIDIGISSAYSYGIGALEIFGDQASALYEQGKRVKLPRTRPVPR